MTAKTILWTVIAAGLLSACGSRPRPAPETKAASGAAPEVESAAQAVDPQREDDRWLRDVERTIATPAPRPMLPLLELESGGPAEGAVR